LAQALVILAGADGKRFKRGLKLAQPKGLSGRGKTAFSESFELLWQALDIAHNIQKAGRGHEVFPEESSRL
jgi:hypothetical protein